MFATLIADDALQSITEGLDALLVAGPAPTDPRQAIAAIKALEEANRKLVAAQAEMFQVIEQRGLHRTDGHFSPKVMVRHVAKLSGAEAATRANIAAAMRDLPHVAGRFRRGRIGVPQMQVIAKIYANRRVRPFMVDAQDWFIERAEVDDFPDFEASVRMWEHLLDDDGPEPRATKNRDARITENAGDLSWTIQGGFGSGMGASINDIFRHYLHAETLADWEVARSEFGDAAVVDDLPRTVQQRRADALWQVFQDAATNPNGGVPVDFVHNVVWSADAYQEMLRRLAGAESTPLDLTTTVCRTINGVPLDPFEMAANSLVNQVRRVIVDAASVTIDQGQARCFTGSARIAVQIADERCTWKGCWVPVSECQIDHTVQHAKGGRTNPHNGGPLCGSHNRLKEQGFRTWRDPVGMWHTYRPDGTEIE